MTDHSKGYENDNPLLSEVWADETTRDHSARLARYASAKDRQATVVKFMVEQESQNINFDLKKELVSLKECGEFLVFRHYYEIDVYKLKAGCTCKKHLLCALCAIRRAAKCIAVYSQKIGEVINQGKEQDIEYDQIFLTFTIKNGPNLIERMDHLKKSFSALMQKRRDSLKKNPKTDTLFKYVEGGIYSYETTFNKDTGYHPHIHFLALVPKGIFQYSKRKIKNKTVFVPEELWQDIVSNWQKITGDSKIIDARLIDSESDQLLALVETFKYALKCSSMDIPIQLDVYRALKGRRLIGSMGSLFGVKLPDTLNDELLPHEQKYVDLVYQYSGVFGYLLTSTTDLG